MFKFLFRARDAEQRAPQWHTGRLGYCSSRACGLEDATGRMWGCDPATLGLATGMEDRDGRPVFSGQRVRSVRCPNLVFSVCFGPHHAWCELDAAWVPTVGFYCTDAAGGQFPLGRLHEWAVVVGE